MNTGTFNAEVTLDCEVEWKCIFAGRPASGPSYGCAGEPAEPAELEIRVMCDGRDITHMLSDAQLENLRDEAQDDYEDQEPDYPDDDDDY
jgi:hypothetical protein